MFTQYGCVLALSFVLPTKGGTSHGEDSRHLTVQKAKREQTD